MIELVSKKFNQPWLFTKFYRKKFLNFLVSLLKKFQEDHFRWANKLQVKNKSAKNASALSIFVVTRLHEQRQKRKFVHRFFLALVFCKNHAFLNHVNEMLVLKRPHKTFFFMMTRYGQMMVVFSTIMKMKNMYKWNNSIFAFLPTVKSK